jgi:uncharacterized membrane protein YsdA (DUF1294 family)
MLKGLLTPDVVVFALGLARPLLLKLGLGWLLGDLQFRHRGRSSHFPLATSLIFSVVITLLLWALRI